MLIYIHGFKSSPLSYKAQLIKEYLARNFPNQKVLIPQVRPYPEDAIQQLCRLIETHYHETIHLVSSSLGSYYATWLSNQYNLKTTLINPVVKPNVFKNEYIGNHENPYTHEQFTLYLHHFQALLNYETKTLRNPKNFYVLLQKGDEVLDYQLAEKKFKKTKLVIEDGGSHAFNEFDRYLKSICRFFKFS